MLLGSGIRRSGQEWRGPNRQGVSVGAIWRLGVFGDVSGYYKESGFRTPVTKGMKGIIAVVMVVVDQVVVGGACMTWV